METSSIASLGGGHRLGCGLISRLAQVSIRDLADAAGNRTSAAEFASHIDSH